MSNLQKWKASPSSRGTLDILWSCLSTLGLCVWTAVHPNVLPSPGNTHSFYERLGMMALAIVFPEIIISAAFMQLRQAKRLCSQINSLAERRASTATQLSRNNTVVSPSPEAPSDLTVGRPRLLPPLNVGSETRSIALLEPPSNATDSLIEPTSPCSHSVKEGVDKRSPAIAAPDATRLDWTTDQAFFAVMGGFASTAMTGDAKQGNLPNTTGNKRILTSEGILELARAGLLPDISKEEIEERSNADVIAKVIVLFQVLWFALQVLSRLVTRLAVTPLEAHTTVHVGCTILVYLLWLKKPYNIGHPIVLEGPDIHDMIAFFSFCEVRRRVVAFEHSRWLKDQETYWNERARASQNILDHDGPPVRLVIDEATHMIGRYTSGEDFEAYPEELSIGGVNTSLKTLAPAANRGLARLRGNSECSVQEINLKAWRCLRDTSENFVIRDVWGAWSSNTGHEMSMDKAVHLLFNLLYGAGHIAAWASTSFPTATERWFWRGSAIMLSSVPVWGCLWMLWWKAVGSRRKILFPFRNGDLDIFVGPFFATIILAYVLARCYFLIESLVSLRLLPEGAYQTVDWSKILPGVS